MSAQDGTCSEGNAQQGYPSLQKWLRILQQCRLEGLLQCVLQGLPEEGAEHGDGDNRGGGGHDRLPLQPQRERGRGRGFDSKQLDFGVRGGGRSRSKALRARAGCGGAGGGEGAEEGEEEPWRLVQEEGWPHRLCMQVRRDVLRHPQIQRQAQLHLRLRGARQVRDRRRQPSDRGREGRQNLNAATTSVILGQDRTIFLLKAESETKTQYSQTSYNRSVTPMYRYCVQKYVHRLVLCDKAKGRINFS